MATKKKLLQAAAGSAGGAGLDVDEVFSTFVADATGSGSLTINNGIDLSGEGGIVWVKSRNNSHNHYIFDPNIGSGGYVIPNSNTVGLTGANYTFTSTGLTDAYNNYSSNEAVWWTWRKAPRFFDVVTYTGDGTNGRQISHNLGHDVGMMLIKKTSSADDWRVFHRSQSNKYAALNSTFQFQTDGGNIFGNPSNGTATAPTSTNFTVANDASVNQSGATYVAYVFAHNDSGDGGFGPDADQDIIKCGSVTLDGSGQGLVNLGFEPSWIMYKRTDGSGNWIINDSMRGWTALPNQAGAMLLANSNLAEGSYSPASYLNSSGFLISGSSGQTFIYMAIRRGPLAEPTSATDVFALGTRGASTPGFTSNFPVDMFIRRYKTGSGYPDIGSRLTGAKAMQTSENFAEGNDSSSTFDHMNGYYNSSSADSNHFSWMWKRAPSYFDCVCYSGTGSARTVNHNLQKPPEMIWVKSRSNAVDWKVYHKDLGTLAGSGEPAWKYELALNQTNASNFSTSRWGSDPTSSVFGVGTHAQTNASGQTYIAYLFATVAGVSKVGSITGNGTALGEDQDIDCGFSNGARFVLIKRSSGGSGGWYVFDTERGIVAGNDPLLTLNNTNAENSGYDLIEPLSSGFTFKYNVDWNFNKTGNTFIFYAIA